MGKARNREADSQRSRLQSVEAVRLGPLGFVLWAFPWVEGVLAGHDGPEAWQTDAMGEIGRQLRANAQGKKGGPVRIRATPSRSATTDCVTPGRTGSGVPADRPRPTPARRRQATSIPRSGP